jgi:LemA protein
MSGSLILWMTLALFIFWGVGLYNRLMRMRARGLGALGSVEKHVRQYAELVQEHGLDSEIASAAAAMPAADRPTGRWAQLQTDLQALDQALRDAKAIPLAADPLTRLGVALDAIQNTWRHLHETPADLAGPVVPADMQARWDAITLRVESARSGFNQILTKYNEALDQFPARLLVGLMGFKPGGLL